MKIAVSLIDKNENSLIDLRFGRCEYFQILDVESNEKKFINNNGLLSSGGAGVAAAQQLIDENVDVIITGKIGPNALKIIEKSSIKVYSCKKEITSMEVIKSLENNELVEI